MLSERLNCFRGRTRGLEFFRTCPPTGEPFRILPASPANGCLGLGGPIIELAGGTGRSLTGDSTKISDRLIDEEVESLTKAIVASGKIPIAIGRGHNNSYPLIKGTAKGLHQAQRIGLARVGQASFAWVPR